MSEATVPQPDADDGWDNIDEAVRDQYGQLLTAGTNLLSDSEIMRRLDPLSLFSPLLRTASLRHPTRTRWRGVGPPPQAKFAPPQLRPCARSAAPRRTRRNMARTGDSQIRPGARMPGTGGSERSTTSEQALLDIVRDTARRPPSSRRRSSPRS